MDALISNTTRCKWSPSTPLHRVGLPQRLRRLDGGRTRGIGTVLRYDEPGRKEEAKTNDIQTLGPDGLPGLEVELQST